jgi:hypothetical protein
MEELSYPVVSDAVRRTPSIYIRTVGVKNASNECELLESLDATPPNPQKIRRNLETLECSIPL